MVRSWPQPTLIGAVVASSGAAGTRRRRPDRRHAGTRAAARRCPRSATAGGTGQLGLVHLADQRRDDVAGREVEIVAGAVEVGRHGADEVAAVLPAVGLAQLDAGDLGQRVRTRWSARAGRSADSPRGSAAGSRAGRCRSCRGTGASRTPTAWAARIRLSSMQQVVVEEVDRAAWRWRGCRRPGRRRSRPRPGAVPLHPGLDLGLPRQVERGAVGGEQLDRLARQPPRRARSRPCRDGRRRRRACRRDRTQAMPATAGYSAASRDQPARGRRCSRATCSRSAATISLDQLGEGRRGRQPRCSPRLARRRPGDGRPRAGGSSAGRSRPGAGRCAGRSPSPRRPAPVQTSSRPISAKASSTNSRTLWASPVASTQSSAGLVLQDPPHALDIVAGMAPVAPGVEVAEPQPVLQAELDRRHRAGDLAGDEGLAAARALVVEQDAVGGEQAVALAVVARDPVGVELGRGVGALRQERRRLALRRRGRCRRARTCWPGRSGSVPPSLRMRIASSSRSVPEAVGVGGVFGRVEADLDVALGGQVVDLVGLHLLDDADQVGGVGQVAIVQEQPRAGARAGPGRDGRSGRC